MLDQEAILQRMQDLVKYYDFTKSGEEKRANWEDCWAETLREFIESDYDIKKLFPSFIGNGDFIRYHGRYDGFSEAVHFESHREDVLDYIPENTDIVLELGSGSGHNVAWFAEKLPNKRIIGADWSKSAVSILEILSRKYPNISGQQFDLFNCGDIEITNNSTIITFHAFEQLGENFHNALQWILDKKPKRVIQTEPIFEFYKSELPFDKVAMDYHEKRNYLKGYWPALQKLESEHKISISYTRKSRFGNHLHSGYSMIVWEPL